MHCLKEQSFVLISIKRQVKVIYLSITIENNMAFPIPTHRKTIKPYDEFNKHSGASSEFVAQRAYNQLIAYLRANTYWFGGSKSQLGDGRLEIRSYASTPDGVTISSGTLAYRGQDEQIIPEDNWAIELFSFTTDVEPTRRKLIEIIKSADM